MRIKLSMEHLEAKPNVEPPPWIGVDLDGTLAQWGEWKGWNHINDPVPEMVKKVKEWLAKGITVKVLTARLSKVSLAMHDGVSYADQAEVIQKWCEKHIGVKLPVTSEKDWAMLFFCDDSAVQIKRNTGKPLAEDGYKPFEARIKEASKFEEKKKDKDE